MSSNPRSRDYEGAVRRVTFVGLAANLALAALKGAAGVFANSQALVADAVHSLSDMATDMAVLVGVRYWNAPPDANHPYGHGRIEVLVALFIGVALAAVGAGIVFDAFDRLDEGRSSLPGWPALVAAWASIAVKEILYRWTSRVGKRVRSSALMANAWHHRSDALSSIPVVVAVVGLRLRPEWTFLDPVAAIIVSVLIIHAAWVVGRPALRQLVDAGADRADRDAICRLALAIEGVRSVHALRTRHIGAGLQVDIHVQVNPELSVREGHAIGGRVKEHLLSDGPDVVDVLIHLEPDETRNGVRS